MAHKGAAAIGSLTCLRSGLASACRAASVALALIVAGTTARAAEPVRGEATFSASGGYARLIFKLSEDVESQVSVAGSILIVRFKRPVDIPIDKIAAGAPDYVGAIRRDPDGSAIRLSLSRKVSINSMTAGERLFVDLLPDSWSGLPPSLPQEVIRELAERARVAERALKLQRMAGEAKKKPPVRVRASVQPTFVRYVFELPDGAGVSSVLNEQKFLLSFNQPFTFDLSEAQLAAPQNVSSVRQKIEGENSSVEVGLIGDVDVHAFREEKNYVVDIGFQQASKGLKVASAAPEAMPSVAPHAEAPAAHAAATTSPAIAPPTSETIAQQAKSGAHVEPANPPAAAPVQPDPPAVVVKIENPTPAKPAQPAAPATEESKPAAGPQTQADSKTATKGPAVTARRGSEGLNVTFSFGKTVPAALFRRADIVWLVFDDTRQLDLNAIRAEGGALVGDVGRVTLEKGQAIRIRLNRPQIASLEAQESLEPGAPDWVLTVADTRATVPGSLMVTRNISDRSRANVSIAMTGPGLLHRLSDPDAGDALMVVTALPPARGFLRRQDFVDFSLLESAHGVVVQPNADGVLAEVAADKTILTRTGGLTLSPANVSAQRAATAMRPIFDPAIWRENQETNFANRIDALIAAASTASTDDKMPAAIELARFYLARGMYSEARAALDVAFADAKPDEQDPIGLILHSVASTLMGQPEQGLKDLANPAIGGNYDAPLWRALALTRLGKWPEAREKFKNVEFAITSLPMDLQRIAVADAMRAALEVKDYSGASNRSGELDIIGVSPDKKPAVSVMRGRLAEALGRDKDALVEYQAATASTDRAAGAEAKFLEVALRQRRNEISPEDALRELETLSAIWRGDGLEVRLLQTLSRMYAESNRFTDSLAAAKLATSLQPNSEAARQSQDEASALFAQLFLGAKGDDMPPVDALAMFYQYRELTPIGRRGDEMIRRLSDRLVAVDLLDQAAELLQYQVDQRLEGAARAQVAARLAMVYLMNRKPERAISALRTTRIADLAGELRTQRLLLEARAQSDIGRHDLALDIISNIGGREAIRLRSDIYWASRRWREASEQLELYYSDRWRDFKPLNSVEKGDVLRAVVGYALAEDALGLGRFREKYAPLMSSASDKVAFDAASKPASATSAEFVQVAKLAAGVDTLDGFLREMRSRFPDTMARAPLPPETQRSDIDATGSLPEIVGLKRVQTTR